MRKGRRGEGWRGASSVISSGIDVSTAVLVH